MDNSGKYSWEDPIVVRAQGSIATEDFWKTQRLTRDGVNIQCYALISQFGPDCSIAQYVADNIIPYLLRCNEFEVILALFSQNAKAGGGIMPVVDEQVEIVLRNVFKELNDELSHSSDALENSFEILELNNVKSGCSAILCLILDDIIYVANCGTSVGILGTQLGEPRGLVLFQLTKTHSQSDNEHFPLPSCYFGGNNCNPFYAGNIQINRTIKFLMLASPSTIAMTSMCIPKEPKHDLEAVGSINTYLCSMFWDAHRTKGPQQSLQYVFERLHSQLNNLPEKVDLLSAVMVYIPLQNDFPVNGEIATGVAGSTSVDDDTHVQSEVDWSEFHTHDAIDEVMARLDSAKQYYSRRTNLPSISEH